MVDVRLQSFEIFITNRFLSRARACPIEVILASTSEALARLEFPRHVVLILVSTLTGESTIPIHRKHTGSVGYRLMSG